jgi:TerC family integral membrane protein
MWAGFLAFVIAMLAVDLFLLGGRKAHRVSFKEAAGWSVVWVGVALAFNALLWWYLDGSQGREIANTKALEFLTGYLVEKSLAVDNVFVWLMLFSYFAIPAEYQRRVLLYGVLGAIVMRTVMIPIGVSLATVALIIGGSVVLSLWRERCGRGTPPVTQAN